MRRATATHDPGGADAEADEGTEAPPEERPDTDTDASPDLPGITDDENFRDDATDDEFEGERQLYGYLSWLLEWIVKSFQT